MIPVDQIPAEPPPELRFRRRVGLGEAFREIWRTRELIRTLAERDLRARYKQAVLGLAWAIIPPLGLLLVFSVFVRRVGDVFTEGVPYDLYAYVGLMAWTFFATSVSSGGNSLIVNLVLLNKVYCPREVFPLSQVAVALVDTVTSGLVLVALFVIKGYAPRATAGWIPVVFVVHLAFTLGVVAIISSTIVYVRDVRHALPILLQLGLFASPVAYSLGAIPDSWRNVYAAANPLGPVIDSYRRVLLLGKAPDWTMLGLAAATSTVLLVGGYYLFKKLEVGIADVG